MTIKELRDYLNSLSEDTLDGDITLEINNVPLDRLVDLKLEVNPDGGVGNDLAFKFVEGEVNKYESVVLLEDDYKILNEDGKEIFWI